jgi:hypothetical protein
MTKIVWLAIALMLLAGTTIVTAAYACGSEECKGHSEGECSNHDKCAGHKEEACSGHAACEGHSEGECSGHDESAEHAKGECHGMAGMMKNLSDEQCAAVHATIKAMKAEGATYEQIHVAVKEMVEGNAEAKAEVEVVACSDAHKENCSGRNWLTKTVFAVGHAFKTVAGAVVGIFS